MVMGDVPSMQGRSLRKCPDWNKDFNKVVFFKIGYLKAVIKKNQVNPVSGSYCAFS